MTQITHLKVLRYPELLEGPLRPLHWDVDPSSVCDHRCRGCPYIYDGAEKGLADPMLGVIRPGMAKKARGFLDFDAFQHFVADAQYRGARAITFVGGGEPTLHPRFADMCVHTHEAGLKFGIVTHLGGDYGEAAFEAMGRATWIRVSLNAGTAQTYLKHQGRAHFYRAIDNMARLENKTRIGASFLITDDNWAEIVEAARRVRTFGGHYIQYKPLIETDASPPLPAGVAELLGVAKTLETETFKVLDQWSDRRKELAAHARGEFSGPCHVSRWNPKLGADGVIYTCCELAYSVEGRLGSIYEEPLSVILDRAQDGGIKDQSSCPHCWAKPVNTMINDGTITHCQPPPESDDQEFL